MSAASDLSPGAGTPATPPASAADTQNGEPVSGAGTDLVLLPNDAMRARRRPLAILALYLWESALALLWAWPAASVARAAYGDHPRGDAPLWNPGGFELLDLLDRGRRAAPTLGMLAFLVGVTAAILGLLPIGGLLASIAFATRERRGPPFQQALARGLRAFPSFLLLLVVVRVAQGILVGAGAALSKGISGWLEASAGEARATQLGWLALFLFMLLAWALGVIQDLARAAVVRFRVRGLRALLIGFSTFRRSLVFWSWIWRAGAALVTVAIGALSATRLGGSGGLSLFCLFVVHQGVVGARVALQASWLARAMRAVDHGHRLVTLAADSDEG
jgi:hypothetical protein